MKQIEIIPLAQRKADKRGIKTEWIEDAFSHPDQVVDGYGGRKVIHKRLFIEEKEYLLRVVYDETERSYVTITAYLTSQIKRYWKED